MLRIQPFPPVGVAMLDLDQSWYTNDPALLLNQHGSRNEKNVLKSMAAMDAQSVDYSSAHKYSSSGTG